MTRRWPAPYSAALAALGVLMLLVGMGSCVHAGLARARNITITYVYASASPSTSSSGPAPSVSTVAPAAPMIEPGVWTVGKDLPPGRYQVAVTSVDALCYWVISKTGTGGGVILDSGAPGGGRPTITVEEGQDVETQNCGPWQRVG